MIPTKLVHMLSNCCNILRDEGLSSGDHLEQVTFLHFLKVSYKRANSPFHKPSYLPAGRDWPAQFAKDENRLETHHRYPVEDLGKWPGILRALSPKAQNRIMDPGHLFGHSALAAQGAGL